ncbi:MAG: fasciclin domain-containing protein [Cyanobacteria bacterium J06634_5]
MQINNSPRFIKSFMVGLIASSAGAFVALPGLAMPKPSADVPAVEAIEAAPVEALVEPTAAEALPEPEATLIESDAADEGVVAEDADADEDVVAEDEAADEDVVAEDAAADEDVVAEDEAADEDAVAEDEAADEGVIAEEEALDADTVEAAEIEALDEEAVEAADTMDGEPVAEDAPLDGDTVVDGEVTEEETPAEAVAEEETDVESAEAESVETDEFTIAELADSSDSLTVLAAALAAADLTEILGTEGPFTVFAPTDEAFAELPEGAVDQLLLPENKDVLVQVLSYHVVPNELMSADLESGDVATVEGSEIAVAVGDTITVDNANVVISDVEASNGIIHVIDRVILPPAPEADVDPEAVEEVQ